MNIGIARLQRQLEQTKSLKRFLQSQTDFMCRSGGVLARIAVKVSHGGLCCCNDVVWLMVRETLERRRIVVENQRHVVGENQNSLHRLHRGDGNH